MPLRYRLRLFRRKKTVKDHHRISPAASTTPFPQQDKSSTTVVASRRPPGQVVSAPSIPDTTSSPNPSTRQSRSRFTVPRPKDDLDLWARAYGIFQGREPELMGDFIKHLSSLQDDPDPLSPRSVQSIVTRLLEDREKKQWRVSLLGKDIKIREQAERLVKFLLWSDEIVSAAVSAQPYAALAWCGVSLLLPVRWSNKCYLDCVMPAR